MASLAIAVLAGYLVVSTQGTNDFVIYEREGNNDYLVTFKVVSGNGIDAVTHTDGIAASSHRFGKLFPEGLLVVQDHINDGYNQNFKVVSWESISRAIQHKI